MIGQHASLLHFLFLPPLSSTSSPVHIHAFTIHRNLPAVSHQAIIKWLALIPCKPGTDRILHFASLRYHCCNLCTRKWRLNFKKADDRFKWLQDHLRNLATISSFGKIYLARESVFGYQYIRERQAASFPHDTFRHLLSDRNFSLSLHLHSQHT